MYRTVALAVITLAASRFLPRGASLLTSPGAPARSARPWQASRPPSHPSHRWEPALRRVLRPKPGGGAATPRTKKLSPKAGAACFRACMRGVSGAGWGNFCDSACYGH
jgi:hypothetical protein